MNIQKRERMNLEKALLTYGNDISFIILRDGTNIEIIDDNDDFVEEKFEENYDNYIYKEIDQNGTLRGKGLKKSLGKPLRKTVLKSSFNDQGKLRSTNNENNVIMKLSENNEYLQCANCFKFFNSKETEEESQEINISNNNNNLNQNQNKIPQNIPRQVIPPQQAYNQRYPQEQNIPRHIPPQQIYNQNNAQFYQKIPSQYPPNPSQYPQNPSQYPPNPSQYPINPPQIPRGPQKRMNMPPPPQNYYNNQIPKGNKVPYYNANQNNQVFRARKRNSGRYQQKESSSEFIQKNYVVNKYPGSAKKQNNQEINYELNNQEKGYIDNNLGNYFNENEIRYYDYPPIKYSNKKTSYHSSKKKVETNYYQPEVAEFQENDYYRY